MILDLSQKVDMLEVNLRKEVTLLGEQINSKLTTESSTSKAFPRSLSTPYKLENNTNDYLCRK